MLAERRRQLAGSLSGGQQQMLAIGRALMSAPRLLLVDEPSVGLAPILVSHTITKIKELKERTGLTVLMAEQNFHQAIRIADRGYIIVHGEIVFEGGVAALRAERAGQELLPGNMKTIVGLCCSSSHWGFAPRSTPAARCACWSASRPAGAWTASRA